MRVIEKTRVWQVGMSLPPDESKGRRWRTNVSQMVVASTAERAIAVAREHHGEGEVWSVNHHGGSTGDLLLDE